MTGLPCRHVALGRAVQRRAGEVATAVVTGWARRSTSSEASKDEVAAIITKTSTIGTRAIGRYLATGQSTTPAEARELATASRRSALYARSPTDLAKNYLTWRDATLRVLAEEAARLGVDPAVLAEAENVVRRSCDSSLVAMVKNFNNEIQSIQQRLRSEREKLAHLALHDQLTGLANRNLLVDRLSTSIAAAARSEEQSAVLFLDLDGFKTVNDNFGHKAGDRLLVRVAESLRAMVRPTDTVARLGGDEFVVLCENLIGGQSALDALVERVRTGLAASFAPDDELAVSVSIGATIAEAGSDPESVLGQADAHMYAVKHGGRAPGRRRPAAHSGPGEPGVESVAS